MKFAAFNVASYEIPIFKELEEKYNIEIELFKDELVNITDTDLSAYDAISVLSIGQIPNTTIDKLTSCKLIALRSIGFQYIDIEYCNSKGIIVTNASYSPYNVADFTIMLMLIALRHAKVSICRALVNDFSLHDMIGREIRSLKIGIIGTGKIGSTVIEELSGFKPEIVCYDLYQNDKVKDHAKYVSLEEIYETCDIISLHMPLTKDNFHMINKEVFAKMKKGAILVNTSRGALIDTEALIDAIESTHLGAAALDTIEGEDGLYHHDMGATVDGLNKKKNIMYLKQFPNVILTQHYAFFTNEACVSMVDCAMNAIYSYKNNLEIKFKIN